jgi:hypothetical protein
MKKYLENARPARDVVRACTICKVYWITTVRSAWGGRPSVCYESAKSFHPSFEAARDAAECMRTRGSAFVIHERPALYLPFETVPGDRLNRRGMAVVEVNTDAPFARCGADALYTLDALPISDMFQAKGDDFTTLETVSDMPVLAGDLQRWYSTAGRARYGLGWSEVPLKGAWDFSHLESLHMRLSQQVRDFRRCAKRERA